MLVSFLYNILTIGIIVAILLISRYYSKKKNDKNSIEVLNQLTSSIYEAFITQNSFGHEKSTKYINISVTSDEILDLIEKVKNWNFQNSFQAILSLKFALETADSKLHEFENLLILANNISPSHSLEWLNLTHELRLFADEYKNYEQFSSSNDSVSLEALKTKEFRNLNKKEQYLNTLQTRFIRFLEATIEWKDLCCNSNY